MDIVYSLGYAFLNGFFNSFQKHAVKKSSATAIMAILTTTALIVGLVLIPFGVAIPSKYLWIFALKGFVIVLSWYIILNLLKNTDLTLVAASMIFSTVLTFVAGFTIFNESVSVLQIVGSVIIVAGVTLMNLLNKTKSGKVNFLTIFLLFLNAVILAGSSVIDKYTTTELSNFQVQFWFLVFACVFAWIFVAFESIKKHEVIIHKHDLINFWPYLVGLFLFVGDFFLFMAYKVPNSQMITITIISKLNIIVTTIYGILVFKEQNVTQKIIYISLILAGAVLVSVF